MLVDSDRLWRLGKLPLCERILLATGCWWLSLTTLFLGTGLLLALLLTGELGPDELTWALALPARTCLLVSFGSPPADEVDAAITLRLVMTLLAGRCGGLEGLS